jgi:hypothetical protein
MSSPIATYRQACFPQKQTTTLYPDRLEAVGTVFFSGDYNLTIPLDRLSSVVNRSSGRSQFFQAGIFVTIVMGFASIASYVTTTLETLSVATVVFLVLILAGIGMTLAAAKRIEMAHFTSPQGFLMFSLYRAGSDRDQFEGFVAQVRQAIHDYHEGGGTPGSGPPSNSPG